MQRNRAKRTVATKTTRQTTTRVARPVSTTTHILSHSPVVSRSHGQPTKVVNTVAQQATTTYTASTSSTVASSRRSFTHTTTSTPSHVKSSPAVVSRAAAGGAAFRPSMTTRNYVNPPNTIRPEVILNTPKPIIPEHQLLSKRALPPVPEGQPIITGANNAPNRIAVGIEEFDPATVDNKFELQPKFGQKFSQEDLDARKIFLNAFPRAPASPPGQIIQTAYSNYPIYNQPIDWRNRLKFVPFTITIKETPDYTPFMDTRWYAEAMPRYKARVDINVRSIYFLNSVEKQVLGELLGPRYDWKTGRVVISCGNLRNNHANINRCFQWLHEAVHRAVEIAPVIHESQQAQLEQYNAFTTSQKALETKMNNELSPYAKHRPRPRSTGQWLNEQELADAIARSSASAGATADGAAGAAAAAVAAADLQSQVVDESEQQFM